LAGRDWFGLMMAKRSKDFFTKKSKSIVKGKKGSKSLQVKFCKRRKRGGRRRRGGG
jgi:hypothetical protein